MAPKKFYMPTLLITTLSPNIPQFGHIPSKIPLLTLTPLLTSVATSLVASPCILDLPCDLSILHIGHPIP